MSPRIGFLSFVYIVPLPSVPTAQLHSAPFCHFIQYLFFLLCQFRNIIPLFPYPFSFPTLSFFHSNPYPSFLYALLFMTSPTPAFLPPALPFLPRYSGVGGVRGAFGDGRVAGLQDRNGEFDQRAAGRTRLLRQHRFRPFLRHAEKGGCLHSARG